MPERTYLYGYPPVGAPPIRLTVAQLETRLAWINLAYEFRRRLLAMFDYGQDRGVDVGIGGGWRSSAQQEQVFRERYVVVPCPGQITWNGQCWNKRPGVAPSAPPGRSYHETTPPNDGGIAADLIGNIAWADAVAYLFGLRSLANLAPPNNELWHHQPGEVATARRNYDGRALAPFPLPGAPPPQPEPEPEDEDVSENLIYFPTREASGPSDTGWTVMREVGTELHGIDGEYAGAVIPSYDGKAGHIVLSNSLQIERFIARHRIVGDAPSSLPPGAATIWNERKDR